MDIYQAMNSRRTVREFQERAIEADIVEKIIAAGLKAPTNDHLRNWHFVVVGDRAKRAEMLNISPHSDLAAVEAFLDSAGIDHPLRRDMYKEAIPRQRSMLYNAGSLIIPLFRCDYPLLQPKNLSYLNCFASIWCCIENMLLAAAAEGIYGVTRIPQGDETERVRNALGHPENYLMPCYLALGYPADSAAVVRQREISLKERIHADVWRGESGV